MRRTRVRTVAELLLAGITITNFRSAIAQEQPGASPAPASSVLCSTLEVKTAGRMGVVLVTFHQANKSDGPRLGELLRQNEGVSVELETSDGRAHTATLFRLGTCFGRGLIVFPTGSARLTPGEQFRLRFPPRSKSG